MNLLDQPPVTSTKLIIGNQEVVLDTNRLQFNEKSLNTFMENLALWYDYFSQKLAEAEAILSDRELDYSVVYAEKFEQAKDEGGTEKLAEARAKKNDQVCAAAREVIAAKFKVTSIKQHLRAWDKAHENSQSRGHMVRKEMDKLQTDINERVNEIVRKPF